jgi:seryl-tRNA(Sec) selenium transferase
VVVEADAGAEALAAALRRAPVPVVARVRDERVRLDLRTLCPDDAKAVEAAFRLIERVESIV